jgi:uncharacterized protein (TIGR00725 family)
MGRMNRPRLVAVIGGSDAETPVAQAAYDVGRELARRGCVVMTGGRTGVMEAAAAGAASAGGLVIGMLPGPTAEEANPHVNIPILTDMGEAANAITARTAHGVIALAGEFGTLSEIAFALKFGRPVVSLNSWEVHPLIRKARSAREAVEVLMGVLDAAAEDGVACRTG